MIHPCKRVKEIIFEEIISTIRKPSQKGNQAPVHYSSLGQSGNWDPGQPSQR